MTVVTVTSKNPVIEAVCEGHIENRDGHKCKLDGEEWPCETLVVARELARHRGVALMLQSDIAARGRLSVDRPPASFKK